MSLVNIGQWRNVLHHLSFRERTSKKDGRHLPASQGNTESYNTLMPETVFGYERLAGARVPIKYMSNSGLLIRASANQCTVKLNLHYEPLANG